MSMLPMPVAGTDMDISADAWLEVDVLVEQIHVESARDTARFLVLLVTSLFHEKDRYAEAVRRHNWPAAAESAAEQRDLVALAACCKDHLTRVKVT